MILEEAAPPKALLLYIFSSYFHVPFCLRYEFVLNGDFLKVAYQMHLFTSLKNYVKNHSDHHDFISKLILALFF